MDILTINDKPGKYPESYYAATADTSLNYPEAQGEISADVCIVGGGYSGLSSALHLARRGFKVVLIEASRIANGASGRNGGQVGTGQREDQRILERQLGKGDARKLWDISLDSVTLVKQLIEESNTDCELSQGIIYSNHKRRYSQDSLDFVKHIHEEYAYDKLSYLNAAQIQEEIACKRYYSGYLDQGSYHLHPLKFAQAIAKLANEAGVTIYENSRMTEIDYGDSVSITTEKSKITAKFCVLAMNGYHNNLIKKLEQKVMPINNYIAVTEKFDEAFAKTLIKNNYAVADSRFVVNYFRLTKDHRLLFGGGESYGYKFPENIVNKVRKPMTEIFPQLKKAKIDYAWGGTLAITVSRMPHFCKIKDNVLSISGYSGHGVALATLAGKMASDAIAGQAESFDIMSQVPTMSFPGGAKLRQPTLVLAMLWYSMLDKL